MKTEDKLFTEFMNQPEEQEYVALFKIVSESNQAIIDAVEYGFKKGLKFKKGIEKAAITWHKPSDKLPEHPNVIVLLSPNGIIYIMSDVKNPWKLSDFRVGDYWAYAKDLNLPKESK